VAGLLVWCVGALATVGLQGRVDLGSQAMPLVLAAAAVGLWWPRVWAGASCVVAVLMFNWFFVTPRGSFTVSFQRDMLLLCTMFAASVGVALLVARQRQLASIQRQQADQVRQLHALGQQLRQAESIHEVCQGLTAALNALALVDVCTAVVAVQQNAPDALQVLGPVSPDEHSGLTICQAQSMPLGPGTGRYENQPVLYMPLRGRSKSPGAVLIRSTGLPLTAPDTLAHIQAMCDLVGQAIEREEASRHATEARQLAHDQKLRNTLLAAVSHDYRTPLATILGAASSLQEQSDRMSSAQRQRHVDTVMDEVRQLSRLTDNALQLARLDAPNLRLLTDWQSPEELVGAVLRRVRMRDPQRRTHLRLAPGLPLVRCDATLVVQLLENLIDNALKYSPDDTPVEVVIRQQGHHLLLAVGDRGPGVLWQQQASMFELFERGQHGVHQEGIRGAGLGLALCKTIAQVHGGTLVYRSRKRGGASFELRLMIEPSPMVDTHDEASA
jgi:two-component system sensor histidine kinase KdpD